MYWRYVFHLLLLLSLYIPIIRGFQTLIATNTKIASTGNICTIRCFNAATAGPFGGCFAVMQTDETASKNTPGTIATAQTLEGVEAQVLQ